MSYFDVDMQSMLDIYKLETGQLLDELDMILLDTEKAGVFDTEELNSIFRIMHTIKGSSSMMGLDSLAMLTHKVEDLFSMLRDGIIEINSTQSNLFDMLFTISDFIRSEMVLMSQENYYPTTNNQLYENIDVYLKSFTDQNKKNELQKEITIPHLDIEGGTTIRVWYEKECQMENVRAYMLTKQIAHMCKTLKYFPENVEINPKSASFIKENGFFLCYLSDDSLDVIKQVRSALFVKEVERIQTNQDSENKQDQNNFIDSKEVKQEEEVSQTFSNLEESHVQSIQVRVDRLDTLQNLTGELMVLASSIANDLRQAGLSELENHFRHKTLQLLSNLENTVISIRMIPFRSIVPKLKRIVRDMGRKEGKEIEIVIIGDDVEIDKNIMDQIFEPMMHMVRNAIDHGIELPDERESKGKSRIGTITLSVKNEGGNIIICMKDDGKGLDEKRILEKAKVKKLLQKNPDQYSRQEIYALIFMPGFTTNDTANEYSGRGVGLDVAKKVIDRFGGHINVESEENVGTSIIMHLPPTLLIIDYFVFRVEKNIFAIPAYQVRKFYAFSKHDPNLMGHEGSYFYRQENNCMPVISLHDFFHVKGKEQEKILLYVKAATKEFCILADFVMGQQRMVYKSLPALLGKAFQERTGISGYSILGDGTICFTLDVEYIDKDRKLGGDGIYE